MKTFLLVVTALVLVSACNKDKPTSWGTYQEPVKSATLPEAAGVSEFKVLWDKKLGSGAESGYAILKPNYGASGLYAANRAGDVFKFAPKSGEVIWKTDLDIEIFSGVGVGKSIVVVTLDDGTVVALSAKSGKELWRMPLARQLSAIPALGQGRVIVRTAGGEILGLNQKNGNLLWTIKHEIPGLSIHGDSSPTINGDVMFAGLANGSLVASGVSDGREYWEVDLSLNVGGTDEVDRLTDSDSSPLVSGSVVYAATYQGRVMALNATDANQVWQAPISSRLPMSLGGGRLLVTNDFGEVVRLECRNRGSHLDSTWFSWAWYESSVSNRLAGSGRRFRW